jgi:hypothetical protein
MVLAFMTDAQKILELNAFTAKDKTGLDPETAKLIERRARTFGPTSMLFYKRPLHVVRAEGVWLYEADGRRYLDAYNNVPSIGHCHPKVAEAVGQQLKVLNTNTRYLYDIIYTYAERLLATFPKSVSNIVFTCTGSESVDLALRIARNITGGSGIIATENAYHGNTTTATQVSPSSAHAEPASNHIYFVPAPDTYRMPDGAAEESFIKAVSAVLDDMSKKGIKPAAMIADSVLSSDGVYPGQPRKWPSACKRQVLFTLRTKYSLAFAGLGKACGVFNVTAWFLILLSWANLWAMATLSELWSQNLRSLKPLAPSPVTSTHLVEVRQQQRQDLRFLMCWREKDSSPMPEIQAAIY